MDTRQTDQARFLSYNPFCPMAHFSHSPTSLDFPTMHTPRLSHPAHGTAKKPSTGDRKQKFDSNCNFCFHDGRIATTGTRPCEKRVKSPSKGKRASPKKQEGETHEPTRLTGQTLRKRRVLATAAGQNPRNSHESQRGQEGLRKNHTTPPATVAGQISRRRTTKQGGGPQDKKKGGVAMQI